MSTTFVSAAPCSPNFSPSKTIDLPEPNRILLLGSSGNTGTLTARTLLECSVNLSIKMGIDPQMIDTPNSQEFRSRGIDVVGVDFESIDSLIECMTNIHSICLILPWKRNLQSVMSRVLEAAKQSNVKFIVKLSSGFARSDAQAIIGIEHHSCDQMLAKSSIKYSIVKPVFLLDNACKFQSHLIRDEDSYYSTSSTPSCVVDGRDVADSLVAILLNPARFASSEFLLTGKELVTPQTLCTAMSRVFGRPIKARVVDPTTFTSVLTKRGIPEFMVQDILAIEREKEKTNVNTDSVKKLTGHPPRTVESFVASYKATLCNGMWLKQVANFFS